MKAAIWALLCIFALPTMGLAELRLSDIEQVWRDRHTRLATVELEWKESTVKIVTTSDDPFSPPTQQQGEFRFDYVRKLLLGEGKKLRFIDTVPLWSSEVGGYLNLTQIVTFDGSLSKGLVTRHRQELPRRFHHQGTISDTTHLADGLYSLTELRPVLLHFRPFHHQDNPVTRYTLEQETATIDGVPCVLLWRTELVGVQQDRVTKSFWLDPARDFTVRRYASDTNGRVKLQLTVNYTENAGWPVPDRWTLIQYDARDRFDRSIEAVVTKCVIHNTVPDAEFDVVFPPTTIIIDERDPATRQQPKFAVVTREGAVRPVSAQEMTSAASAGDILDADPKARFPRPLLWLAVGVVAFGIFICVRKLTPSTSTIRTS